MKRIVRSAGALVLLFAGFIYLNNTDWLTSAPAGGPVLLAHRGLAQTFDLDGVTNDSCTATRIHAPTHPYLENTIASMVAAFRVAPTSLSSTCIRPLMSTSPCFMTGRSTAAPMARASG